MRQSAEGRGHGRSVNIASVAGKEGSPSASHCSASKTGLSGEECPFGTGADFDLTGGRATV